MDYVYTDLILELEDVEEQIYDLDKRLRSIFWYVEAGDTYDKTKWETLRLLRTELWNHKIHLEKQLFKYNL